MAAHRFAARDLKSDIGKLFAAAGSNAIEAEQVAECLVNANLAGHDSHGVARAPRYIDDLSGGGVVANCHASVALEMAGLVIVDGNNGFGQVIGRETMAIGIDHARDHGAAVVVLRHSAHLGRIGDWAEMAAQAGLASFHFVNVTGDGTSRVAPFGGADARLATNPVAAGIPRPDGRHIILDMATSVVAEGKVFVTANRGLETPPGWLIDPAGQPTRDPRQLYADPPGALLPFGAYKGYGMSLICDLFAGALTGGGGITARHPVAGRVENNMVTVLIDPARMTDRDAFGAEVERIVAYVSASPPNGPGAEVLVPGDPERKTRAERLHSGIPIEPETWRQIVGAARSVGLAEEDLIGSRPMSN